MKASFITLILIQAIIALISAYLISQMSFVGRMSINLYYKEYGIFKDIIRTAILLFSIQFCLVIFLYLCKKFVHQYLYIAIIIIVISSILGGAYQSYLNFTMTSHKHMRLLFHSGIYLFWFASLLSSMWISIAIKNKKKSEATNNYSKQNSLLTLDKTKLSYEKSDHTTNPDT